MDKVVILDAGHGGINPNSKKYITSGKRSPVWEDGTQYFEGVGNREIVLIASQYLMNAGWKVLYTVDPRGWIDTPLWQRVRRSNEHYAKNPTAFQISVHSNAATPAAHGAEVFTYPGQTKSDKMADIWLKYHQEEFPKMRMRTDRSDGDNDKESLFTMNSVQCPSILIETMFHTNREECKILLSDEGKEKCAIAIVQTCFEFHEKHIA